MRHKKLLGKLGRDAAHRKALHRNMVTQLITHERIVTTHPKAKMLKVEADRVIRWGKSATQNDYKAAVGFLKTPEAVNKLFLVLGPRYKGRDGGYTRIIKTNNRYGDNATQSVVEYVDNGLPAWKEEKPVPRSIMPELRRAARAKAEEEKKKSIEDLD